MHTDKTKRTTFKGDQAESDKSPASQLSQAEAESRLQQAAHILVTGARRAVQEEKAARNNLVKKPTKSSKIPKCEIQTSGEIGCKKVQKSPAKKASKASKSNSSGKNQGGKVQ